MPDKSIVLGDLKTTSSVKATKARKPATEQLGAYLYLLSKSYPKICVDKVGDRCRRSWCLPRHPW